MENKIVLTVGFVEKRKYQERAFDIYIVPNKFSVNYNGYVRKAQKIKEINDRLVPGLEAHEIKEIEKELADNDLNKILDDKYELVRTLMIANDYEFDREWWDTRVDPLEVDDFIGRCAFKDIIPSKKKDLLGKSSL